MIGPSRQPLSLEKGGEAFGGFLPCHVDDCGCLVVRAEAVEEQGSLLVLEARGDAEFKIWPVEGELDMVLLGDTEMLADVVRYRWGSSGGEGKDAVHLELLREVRQLEVVGSEVVAPLRDAMCFIDGE